MVFRCLDTHSHAWVRVVVGIVMLCAVAAAATADEMKYPLSLAATPDGDLYVADRSLPGVWKIVDGNSEVFFQGAKKFRTPLNAIRCLSIDDKGKLLAGDSSTRQVYRFDDHARPNPLMTTAIGLGIPMSIAVDRRGTLFVADLETHRIWKIPAAGGKPVEFAAVRAPHGLTLDATGRLWVVSHGKNQLLRISAEGKIEPIVRGRPFSFPHEVVVDKQNVAYVSDGYAKTIWKVDSSGTPKKWITGKPLVNPVGLAWQGKTLLIVDPHAKAVFAADAEGKLTTVVSAKAKD